MLSDGALDIVMTHSEEFGRVGFLEEYEDEELDEALQWFRERKPKTSGRRQRLILEELESRKTGRQNWEREKETFSSKNERQTFWDDWEKTRIELREAMRCG